MTLRSNLRKLISWIPLEIAPREGERNYLDFVTYFGLVSLSMGAIASLEAAAKDHSARDSESGAAE